MTEARWKVSRIYTNGRRRFITRFSGGGWWLSDNDGSNWHQIGRLHAWGLCLLWGVPLRLIRLWFLRRKVRAALGQKEQGHG